MKNNKLLLLTAMGLSAVSANADWQLVNEFNDADDLAAVWQAPNIGGSGAKAEIEDGMLKLIHGDLFEATSNLWAAVDLGVDLQEASLASDTGLVTIYFEVKIPTVNGSKAVVDVVWGLSNEDEDSILDVRYNSYNFMQRQSKDDSFDSRNGGSYVSHGTLEEDVLTKFWITVDYDLNYWIGYVQGGTTWPDQTQLSNGTDEIMLFRVDPGDTQTVDKFLFALSRGNTSGEKGIDYSYFDNIYVDLTGVNLTAPVTTPNTSDMDVAYEGACPDSVETMFSYTSEDFQYIAVCGDSWGTAYDTYLGTITIAFTSRSGGWLYSYDAGGYFWQHPSSTESSTFLWDQQAGGWIWTADDYDGIAGWVYSYNDAQWVEGLSYL